MKKVSVIIPCFNAVKWLPQCFLSLVGQTIGMESLELIFVNDASTDDGKTWEMLCELESAYPLSIAVINLTENRRQGGARNEGLKYASGEYVAFVDADDWIEPDLFEKVYDRAKEIDADIVQFNYYYTLNQPDVNIKNTTRMADSVTVIESDEDRARMLMSERFTYGCWNKLYKKELVDRAGVHFAEHVIYEEPLFVYPLLYYGRIYATMDAYLYHYRQNDSGTMRKDMREYETLLQHADVQLMVWQFMKNTVYFNRFYEEIKLYFLHTYFYETIYFAVQRGMEVTMQMYDRLAGTVRKEVKDFPKSRYASVVPMQMELYKMAAAGEMNETKLQEYAAKISDLIR